MPGHVAKLPNTAGTALNADPNAWCRLEGAGLRLVLGLNPLSPEQ